MEIRFVDYSLNRAVMADCIYGSFKHQTTPTGVVIGQKVSAELERFLVEFNRFQKVREVPFYRIDAYFDQNTLWILEVNAAFVDGWGTALNLGRAAGISADERCLVFPTNFATIEDEYLPELELLVAELGVRGLTDHQIVPYQVPLPRPLFVYGRVKGSANHGVFPVDGLRLDNKINLAMFGRTWQSKFVKVPRHYLNRFDTWQDVPQEVVLKFCDKDSQESHQARTSVLIGKPQGKAKFLKGCYEAETLLAQEYVQPTTHALGNAQLILLTTGNSLVTGYVQYSQKSIINDNSIHGPLCFE